MPPKSRSRAGAADRMDAASLRMGHLVLGALVLGVGVLLWVRTEPLRRGVRCANAPSAPPIVIPPAAAHRLDDDGVLREGLDPSVVWSSGGIAGPASEEEDLRMRVARGW